MTAKRTKYMKEFAASQKSAGVRRVNVTLSASEYARILKSANGQNERVTTHLKTLSFAQLDSCYLVPLHLAENLDTLLAIMRGIGNNINQLARHSNEMRYFLDTDEVRLQLKRMDEEVQRFITQPTPDPNKPETK